MSNGSQCCALEICCNAGSRKQLVALAKMLHEDHPEVPIVDAEQMAEWMLKNFDLAPKGTLSDFKRGIAKIAREHGDE